MIFLNGFCLPVRNTKKKIFKKLRATIDLNFYLNDEFFEYGNLLFF